MVLIVRGLIDFNTLMSRVMSRKYSQKEQAFLKDIGQNIRDARDKQTMSQEALAMAADLDRSYMGSVERGERNISIINLSKIAKALNLTLSQLLKGV